MTHDFATLEVYRSLSLRRNQRWRWRLRHINGSILAEAGEGYFDKDEALRQAVEVVGGSYREAVASHL